MGRPATVVFADSLGAASILAGIRSGRVFLDLTGNRAARLDYLASAPGGRSAVMGGELRVAPGEALDLEVTVEGVDEGARLRSVGGPGAIDLPVPRDGTLHLKGVALREASAWLRFEVVDRKGARLLVGNPIYLRKGPGGA